MTQQAHLFIDESCTPYVGEPRYRFFIICGVIMNEDQCELANLLMKKWREKYLSNQDRCFHAAEFFEQPNYRKKEVNMARNLHKAVDELISIIANISPSIHLYYVDLPRLRLRLGVTEPPIYIPKTAKTPEDRRNAKNYKRILEDAIGNKRYAPLAMTIVPVLNWHKEILEANSSLKGYLNFETLSNSDQYYINIYHKHTNSQLQNSGYKYGERILGINFLTKGSLSGGIELADIISYSYCQSLRSKYRCKDELKSIPHKSILQTRRIRDFIRDNLDIQVKDVTENKIVGI
jgi:hypothetical protein